MIDVPMDIEGSLLDVELWLHDKKIIFKDIKNHHLELNATQISSIISLVTTALKDNKPDNLPRGIEIKMFVKVIRYLIENSFRITEEDAQAEKLELDLKQPVIFLSDYLQYLLGIREESVNFKTNKDSLFNIKKSLEKLNSRNQLIDFLVCYPEVKWLFDFLIEKHSKQLKFNIDYKKTNSNFNNYEIAKQYQDGLNKINERNLLANLIRQLYQRWRIEAKNKCQKNASDLFQGTDLEEILETLCSDEPVNLNIEKLKQIFFKNLEKIDEESWVNYQNLLEICVNVSEIYCWEPLLQRPDPYSNASAPLQSQLNPVQSERDFTKDFEDLTARFEALKRKAGVKASQEEKEVNNEFKLLGERIEKIIFCLTTCTQEWKRFSREEKQDRKKILDLIENFNKEIEDFLEWFVIDDESKFKISEKYSLLKVKVSKIITIYSGYEEILKNLLDGLKALDKLASKIQSSEFNEENLIELNEHLLKEYKNVLNCRIESADNHNNLVQLEEALSKIEKSSIEKSGLETENDIDAFLPTMQESLETTKKLLQEYAELLSQITQEFEKINHSLEDIKGQYAGLKIKRENKKIFIF